MKRGWLFIPHAITKQCWTIILSSHQDSNAEGSFVKPKWAPWKFSQTLFYTLFYPRKLKVSLQRMGNISLFSLQISVRNHPKWSNQWKAEVSLLFIRGSESHHQSLMAITWSQSLKFQLSNTRTPLPMHKSCCRVPGEIPRQQSRLPYCAPGQGSGGQPIPSVAKAWLMVAEQRSPQNLCFPVLWLATFSISLFCLPCNTVPHIHLRKKWRIYRKNHKGKMNWDFEKMLVDY